MSKYIFPINKADILRYCMLSPIKEEPLQCTPDVYPKDNFVGREWFKVISPGRTKFVEQAAFRHAPDTVVSCDKLYFPLDGDTVNYDDFWFIPTIVDFAAEYSFTI